MFATVQPTRRWNSLVPLVLLLLGFILLAIATTIVLSLISIYLPTRDVSPVNPGTSGPQQVTFHLLPDANITDGQTLDSAQQTSVQNQMQNALSGNSETNGRATVQVTNAVGANLGKRKRQDETVKATVLIVTYELIFTVRCVSRRCRIRVLELAIFIFSRLQIIITGTSSSGSSGSTTLSPTTSSSSSSANEVTADIGLISQYWGNLRPYEDSPANLFGVLDTGLPAGCQVEQAFVLHRHAARYPAASEAGHIDDFTETIHNSNGTFTGLLAFLNTWTNQLGTDALLPEGASMEHASGANFWDKYGRILYKARAGQAFYNSSGQTTPLLRCNTIPRVRDSANAWAQGFFGIYNATNKYSLLVIPATPTSNNTLSSFLACRNFLNTSYGIFDISADLFDPVEFYLEDTVTRLSQYVPADVNLTVDDVFIMQLLCAYEYVVFGSSDFCSLFTLNEWRGFHYTFDLFIYNGFSFGSPLGRAIGIGVLEELIARLKSETIPVSDSSVNSTLDGVTSTFPLGQLFYLDMTHDFLLVGLLTAMSLDYFRQELILNNYPPPEDRHFKTSYLIPYASRFITEKIGCVSSNPTATNETHTQYTPTQYGYSSASATNKFIRMRLNNAILPLETIRGGFCAGRTDGLCPLNSFLASQVNASDQANYGQLCFGNYVYNASRFTGDGNYFPE